MTVHTRHFAKTCRSMSFALMMAVLSLGAISGCSNSNDDNDWFGAGDSDGSDGGLGAVDPNAGIYPNPQNITPFVGDDPRKLQFWDLTYSWTDDPDGGTGTCTKGNVQIMNDELQVTQTAAVCPDNIGQVTPCNPRAGEDDQGNNVVASGAVRQSAKGCIRDGQGVANCSATPVSGPTDALTCQQAVEREDPLAAGAVWYQRLAGIPPGTSANYWWGKAFGTQGGEANTYGGTQMVYWGDSESAISVAASGGGEYSKEVQPIYMCNSATADVTNTDDCGLSSLFGTCLRDGQNCRINNLTEDADGFFNVYFKSAPVNSGYDESPPPPTNGVACDDTTSVEPCSGSGIFTYNLESKNYSSTLKFLASYASPQNHIYVYADVCSIEQDLTTVSCNAWKDLSLLVNEGAKHPNMSVYISFGYDTPQPKNLCTQWKTHPAEAIADKVNRSGANGVIFDLEYGCKSGKANDKSTLLKNQSDFYKAVAEKLNSNVRLVIYAGKDMGDSVVPGWSNFDAINYPEHNKGFFIYTGGYDIDDDYLEKGATSCDLSKTKKYCGSCLKSSNPSYATNLCSVMANKAMISKRYSLKRSSTSARNYQLALAATDSDGSKYKAGSNVGWAGPQSVCLPLAAISYTDAQYPAIASPIVSGLCAVNSKSGVDLPVGSTFLPFKTATSTKNSHFVGPALYRCLANKTSCAISRQDQINFHNSMNFSKQWLQNDCNNLKDGAAVEGACNGTLPAPPPPGPTPPPTPPTPGGECSESFCNANSGASCTASPTNNCEYCNKKACHPYSSAADEMGAGF